MSAVAEALSVEPIVGYRLWRILPFTTLDGEQTYRLCSAGTRGIPKVWEPRRATVALCSDFHSTHEAPWPEHECGLWALRSLEDAEERLAHFLQGWNGSSAVGWALGRVSLWGVVVEHEQGWRAQRAYPYDVVVRSPERTVADEIRRVYAVDATWEEAELPEPPDDHTEDRLAEIQVELAELRRDLLREQRATLAAVPGAAPPKPRPLPPLPELGEITPEDVLLAMLAQIAERCHRWPEHPETVAAYDVLQGLVWQRDPADSGTVGPARAGYDAAIRKVSHVLQRLQDAGLVASGKWRHYDGTIGYRMTPAGLEQFDPPATIEVWTWWPAYGVEDAKYRRVAIPSDAGVAAVLGPPPLFAHEVDELRSQWRAEREAAQAKGRRYYRKWLLRWRAESGHTLRLYYDDDEIYGALAKAVKFNAGEPVLAAKVMDELAPGKWTLAEIARVSQTLVRLRGAGKVDRAETPGKKRWTVA